MKYASQIVGLPVISLETGEKFEKVRDLIFDEENNALLGILTDDEGVFSEAHAIPFASLKTIGDDAVIVPSAASKVEVDMNPEIKAAFERNRQVKGKTVMTEDGKDLGKVSDLEIDEAAGRVTGYQTSGGIFADMYKGKVTIPAPMTIKIGEDVVFVPNETVSLVEEHMGGLKAAGQSVAEKAGEMKDKAGELKDTAQAKTQEVTTSSDTKEKVDELKEKATGLYEQVKEKAGELKDSADAKVEEAKVKGALGRPTNRVILDGSDQVILNAGDLITNEAVEKARSAGVLDVLLSSVLKQDPSLTNEDLRA